MFLHVSCHLPFKAKTPKGLPTKKKEAMLYDSKNSTIQMILSELRQLWDMRLNPSTSEREARAGGHQLLSVELVQYSTLLFSEYVP